jgi:hypothetical protein
MEDMKKFFLLAVAAMMVTMSVSAQHREGDNTIQPRVGISMSTLTNWDGAKMKVNLAYGVEFEHFFTEDFSAAAGLLFTNQGAKFEDEGQIKLHYVAFPITANYYVLPGLAVKAGVQPAYRVKTQMKDSDVTVDFDRFIETVFQDFDFNMPKFELEIPVGLSYEYNGVTLDARYNFGLTKLITGIDDAIHQRVIVLTLGYKF